MNHAFIIISLICCVFTPSSTAYWRIACSISQTSRIDPILNPGGVSAHVHKFAGGSNVHWSSTQATLQTAACSSCQVQADKSAYWTPQLYFQHDNGTFEEVENDGMTVYYVGRGGTSSNTVAFPPDFKMISGDSKRRHYDEETLTYLNRRPVADRVSFRCINDANDVPETHNLSATDCVHGLRAQVNFQSCWNGKDAYLPNSAHVAYLSGIDYGVCPPTHPMPIPGLFYEVLYWTNRVSRIHGGRFVFANGDATGYGFHGDFMNGWPQGLLDQAVRQCLYDGEGDGDVSKCRPLKPSYNLDHARICPESPSVVQEVVKGPRRLSRLPGCNSVTSGPADSIQVVCPANVTSTVTRAPRPASPSAVAPAYNERFRFGGRTKVKRARRDRRWRVR